MRSTSSARENACRSSSNAYRTLHARETPPSVCDDPDTLLFLRLAIARNYRIDEFRTVKGLEHVREGITRCSLRLENRGSIPRRSHCSRPTAHTMIKNRSTRPQQEQNWRKRKIALNATRADTIPRYSQTTTVHRLLGRRAGPPYTVQLPCGRDVRCTIAPGAIRHLPDHLALLRCTL